MEAETKVTEKEFGIELDKILFEAKEKKKTEFKYNKYDDAFIKAVDKLIYNDDDFKFLISKWEHINICLTKIFENSKNSLKFFYPKEETNDNDKTIKRLIKKNLTELLKEENPDIITKKDINEHYYSVVGDEKRFILIYQTIPTMGAMVCFNDKKICKNIIERFN